MPAVVAVQGAPAARAWPWWLAIAAGVLVAVVWFQPLLALPRSMRLRGDAMEYLTIVRGFSGFGSALTFAGGRSAGFPFVLYALLRGFRALSPQLRPAQFLSFVAYALLAFHLLSVVLFSGVMRRVWRLRTGRELHWGLPLLLLAYPGMVAHTTVVLTDTFAADLCMLAFAAFALATLPGASRLRGAGMGVAAGWTFGVACLCRPTFVPALAFALLLVCAAAVAIALRHGGAGFARGASGVLAASSCALACAGLLGLASVPCTARYGSVCLADPSIVPRLVPPSLRVGVDSVRAYWSGFARPAEQNADCGGCVAVRDPLLSRTWARHCTIDASRFGFGVPECFVRRPDLAALFVVKKTIGLLDSYQLQDYAVDVTSRLARWWSRPFGALAFAGVLACLLRVLLRLRNRRRAPLPAAAPAGLESRPQIQPSAAAAPPLAELLIVALTLAQTVLLSLGHIEGRYGYAIVPGAVYALFALIGSLHGYEAWVRRSCSAALLLAGAIFLVQTAAWDSHDVVLARIEHSRARAARH